jgi:O-antigen/teichoic acid export membrane protein
LLIQDLWRRLAFLRQRPVLAVYNDGLYLVVEIIAFTLLWFYGTVSSPAMLLCWGLGAGAGAALGFLQFRPSQVSLKAGFGTLRGARHLSVWLTFDSFLNRSSRQLVFFIIAIFAGRAGLGGIQAANNLLGFTNVLILGGSAAALAEGSVALRAHGTVAMRKAVRTHVLLIYAGVGLACLLFAAFSRTFMEFAYGPKFDKYLGLAPIVALGVFVACLDTLPVVELRLRQRTRQMFTTRLLFTCLGLAGAVALAYSLNTRGGAFATVAIGGALTAGAWLALRKTRRTDAPQSEPESIG